jgi:hypothetical protein
MDASEVRPHKVHGGPCSVERSRDGEDEQVFVSCRTTPQHCFFHSFPQPIRVTNNLDREFWKAQSCRMHEGSTNNFITGDKFEAKSLFQNILAVSPCGSRFCPDPAISRARKFLGIRILGKVTKKNIETCIPPRISVRSHQSGLRPADSRGRPSPHLPSIPVYLSRDDDARRDSPQSRFPHGTESSACTTDPDGCILARKRGAPLCIESHCLL